VNKRRSSLIRETKFERVKEMWVGNRLVVAGEIIKISGEYGARFKFDSLVTNKETGAQWIDCFEVQRGQVGAYRSFKSDSIKRIPQRGKRAKRVI
jgi:hypothetical protein